MEAAGILLLSGSRFANGRIGNVEPVVLRDFRQGPFAEKFGRLRGQPTLTGTFGTDIFHRNGALEFTAATSYISYFDDDDPQIGSLITTGGAFTLILRCRHTTYTEGADQCGVDSTNDGNLFDCRFPHDHRILVDVGDLPGGGKNRILVDHNLSNADFETFATYIVTGGPAGLALWRDGVLMGSTSDPLRRANIGSAFTINRGKSGDGMPGQYTVFAMYPAVIDDADARYLSLQTNVFQLFESYIPIAYTGEAAGGDHIVNLPAVELPVEVGVPTVTATVTQQVTLGNATELPVQVAIPTVEARVDQGSTLGAPVVLGFNVVVPTVDVPVDHQVNLPAVETEYQARIGDVVAGADAIITLGNAVDLAFVVPPPPVEGQITYTSNLPAVELGIEARVGTTEGESDLPPTITVPTSNQVYNFGASGTLAAPSHEVGTGDNPVWTLQVDNFGSQPGVMTWSINAATGDITYQINQLSADPDEQALNTKGPYNVTRRLTTTVAHADDAFTVAVNVGNRTLQMTPGGKPVMTWTTKTAASRGLEPTKDPSARVTQTYTVT